VSYTHSQLEGFIGSWFLARGWYPALTELHIGTVEEPDERLPQWAQERLSEPERYALEHDMIRGRCGRRAWIADVAGYCNLTATKLKYMGLYHLRKEFSYNVSWVAEVKVQRQDFTRDDKWASTPQANIQFVVYPKDLVKPEEIPNGWIGLEVVGERVRKHIGKVAFHPMPVEDERDFAKGLLWALWWRKGDEAYDEMERRKQASIVRRDSAKVSGIIEATAAYLRSEDDGWDLERCLRAHGVRRKPGRATVERMERYKNEIG